MLLGGEAKYSIIIRYCGKKGKNWLTIRIRGQEERKGKEKERGRRKDHPKFETRVEVQGRSDPLH